MAGRFVSQKDINLFNTINKELVGDLKNGKDGIINQTVVLYKLSVEDTQVNMYGESSNDKSYLSGVRLACFIEAEDFDFNTDEFGPDLRQDATFSFQRDVLLDLDVVVEVGDIILFSSHAQTQEYTLNGEEVLLMSQNEVLSILETE